MMEKETELLLNREIYTKVIQEELALAEKFIWIATADLKDMHVQKGKRFVPFLELLDSLLQQGVAIRLIHAKEPGERFRKDFDRFSSFRECEHFERVLCPRMHMKCIIVDGKKAFVGSANLTGAGMGSKNEHRRNFEAGIWTEDQTMIYSLMEFIDTLYLGDFCVKCGRREFCPDPIV